MEKIDILKDMLSLDNTTCEIKQAENGDYIISIINNGFLKTTININCYELIHLLEHYVGIDRVLTMEIE